MASILKKYFEFVSKHDSKIVGCSAVLGANIGTYMGEDISESIFGSVFGGAVGAIVGCGSIIALPIVVTTIPVIIYKSLKNN